MLVPMWMAAGVPGGASVILVLLICLSIGLLQGVVVVKTGIPSFIVTLGGLMWWRGVIFALTTGGHPSWVPRDDAFLQIFSHQLFANGIYVSVLWFIGVAIVLTLILQRTRFGNWILATGGNKPAARQQGVPVNRVKLLLFGITAMLAGLGGIVQMTRYAWVEAIRGELMEMQLIAAIAIGGTRLYGGYGSITGTMLGVIMIAMIQNGLVLALIPAYWFKAFLGVVIVIAVMVNTQTQKRALGAGELQFMR